MESYVKIGRLFVLIQFFLIPVYYLLLALFAFPPYTLFDSPELNGFIQLVVTPLTLAFPLMLWT
ncbi:MAG: hypothetical protein ACTSRU_16305, partial [Candidatus Hodarchaeales archaeon]